MTVSDEGVGDKPVRKHFNAIIFSAMAFMALMIVAAILFFHFHRSGVAPLSQPTGTPQTSPATQK